MSIWKTKKSKPKTAFHGSLLSLREAILSLPLMEKAAIVLFIGHVGLAITAINNGLSPSTKDSLSSILSKLATNGMLGVSLHTLSMDDATHDAFTFLWSLRDELVSTPELENDSDSQPSPHPILSILPPLKDD